MTPTETSELRRLLAEATPGEWDQSGLIVYDTCMDSVCSTNDAGDAALIVAMKNALPGLLDEVERNQWRPIETAPKDGTSVELWVIDPDTPHGYRIPSARWSKKIGWVSWIGSPVEAWQDVNTGEYQVRAIRWRPLPTPPANLGGRDDG